jgi:uncharacterized protein (DUF488 family)
MSRPRTAIAMVGVYGFTLQEFLEALRGAGVSRILDVRRRRGVRGSEYAWANARRLVAALEEAGIGYEHHLELAPSSELLRLQHAEDDRLHVGRRARTVLAPEYVRRYEEEVLAHADLGELLARLPQDGLAALLCVERDSGACHRSLIAARLADEHGASVVDVRPP